MSSRSAENGNKKQRAKKSKHKTIKGVPPALTPILILAVKKTTSSSRSSASSSSFQHNDKNSIKINQQDDEQYYVTQFLNQAKNHSSEVHTSCLTFLLDTVENTDYAWNLRRGAQNILQQLLLRSKDCRELFANDRMRRYIAVISEGRGRSENHSAESVQLVEDVGAMLLQLSAKFGQFYPRFSVACRWLEERKGVRIAAASTSTQSSSDPASITTNTGGFSVAQLRIGRDAAMVRGETECRIVRKIVLEAERCFEVLIPRMEGVDYGDDSASKLLRNDDLSRFSSASPQSARKNDQDNFIADDNDDDGDDSSIEWEDGDADADANQGTNSIAAHEMAVERTLQAMGVQRPLEINFGESGKKSLASSPGKDIKEPINGVESNKNKDDEAANQKDMCGTKLKQCIDLLRRKHYPRVQLWVEALSTADNFSVDPQSSRIVSMSRDETQRRGFALVMLMDIKRSIARTLSRAAKLGLDKEGSKEKHQSDQRDDKGEYESKKRARITWGKTTGSAVAQNMQKTREQKLILALKAKRRKIISCRGLRIKK